MSLLVSGRDRRFSMKCDYCGKEMKILGEKPRDTANIENDKLVIKKHIWREYKCTCGSSISEVKENEYAPA